MGGAPPSARPPQAAPPAAAPLPGAFPPAAAPPPGAFPPAAAPPPGAFPPAAAPPPGAFPPAAAPPPASEQSSEDGDLVGQVLNGRYRVDAHIGEGGFGDIYRAKQVKMNRDVAIKVLAPGMSQDEKLVARFKREAQSACNLRDPHTIITYDFDQTEQGVLYIAMELLQGETLFDVLEREERLAPQRVVAIMEECCTSLGEAHMQGIVHRDIKPENIFLEARPDHPDFVKILDFGIAKIVAGEMSQGPALTAAGQTLGTLEYMSPEQLMGQKLDGRSDIYAFGMVCFQMLTGDLPFGDSASPATMIQWHLKQQPASVSQAVPGSPPDLDRIIFRMLAKNRDERYPSVVELRQDLQRLMASQGWFAGGASGPMTAVPPAPLPSRPAPMGQVAAGAAPQPPPGGFGHVEVTAPVTVPVHAVSQASKGKGRLMLLLLIGVLLLAVGGFLAYWFGVRGSGDGSGEESGALERRAVPTRALAQRCGFGTGATDCELSASGERG